MSMRQNCSKCKYYVVRPSGNYDGYCEMNEIRVTECSVCVCYTEESRRDMKVYAVCELCDDYYYGYLAPRKLFKNKERAQAYAKDLVENAYNVIIKEYEIE